MRVLIMKPCGRTEEKQMTLDQYIDWANAKLARQVADLLLSMGREDAEAEIRERGWDAGDAETMAALMEEAEKLAEQDRKLAEQERKRREALTLGDFREHGEDTRGYVELLFTMGRETARRKAQEYGWAWNEQSMKDLEQDALERIEMLEGRR